MENETMIAPAEQQAFEWFRAAALTAGMSEKEARFIYFVVLSPERRQELKHQSKRTQFEQLI